MHDALLIAHFLGLALGLGASFASLTLGLATRELPADERTRLLVRALALGKNASAGLALLIVSGTAMLLLRGVGPTFAAAGGALHAKLTLVVVIVGLFGYQQVLGKRARVAGGGPALARAATVGRTLLATTVATVVLAVLAFH